jgi:hypothetical protein
VHGLDACYYEVEWRCAGECSGTRVGEEEVLQVRETIFADDARLYSASVGGIKKMVDACMLFSVGLLECVRT